MTEDMDLLPERRTPTQLALRRFRKNKRAVICSFILGFIGLATILVPFLSPHRFEKPHIATKEDVLHPPDAEFWKGEDAFSCKRCTEADYTRKGGKFWFGTDNLGRDLFTRTFRGGQVSFAVGIVATLVSIFIGLAYGAIAAFVGGKVDLIMMRIVDVMYGLPYMFVVIIVMAFFKESRSFVLIFLVLGMFSWLTMARIVRGQVLSLREREFVEAARALGVHSGAIIRRHLIPNILGPVIVYATLTVPAVMLTEAFLSFLGLGISEPNTSWGVLIFEGASALGAAWWLVTFPGILFALTLFCLNAVGDGLRDAFDVQQQ